MKIPIKVSNILPRCEIQKFAISAKVRARGMWVAKLVDQAALLTRKGEVGTLLSATEILLIHQLETALMKNRHCKFVVFDVHG